MLLSLLLPLFAFASTGESAIVREFQQNAAALPRKMMALGYRRIGNLDFSRFVGSLGQIETSVVKEVSHDGQRGGFTSMRDSAQWSRKGGRIAVQINGGMWGQTPQERKPMLSFHESLGALGFEDAIFSCSGSIWVLTNPEARKTLSREEIDYVEKIAESTCVFAGGSTVVTGGGDDFNVRTKIGGLRTHLRGVQRAKSREERQAEFENLTGMFYVDIEIFRHPLPKRPGAQDSRAVEVCLGYRPILRTIRVTTPDGSAAIPPGAKNGWTFNAQTNCVEVHGRYAVTENGMSPGVFASRR